LDKIDIDMKVNNNGNIIDVQGLWVYNLGSTYTKGDIIFIGDHFIPYYVTVDAFTAESDDSYINNSIYYIDYLNTYLDSRLQYVTYSQFYSLLNGLIDGITGSTVKSISITDPDITSSINQILLELTESVLDCTASVRYVTIFNSNNYNGRYIYRSYKTQADPVTKVMFELIGLDSSNSILYVGEYDTNAITVSQCVSMNPNSAPAYINKLSDTVSKLTEDLSTVLNSGRFIIKLIPENADTGIANYTTTIPPIYKDIDYIEFIVEQDVPGFNQLKQFNSRVSIPDSESFDITITTVNSPGSTYSIVVSRVDDGDITIVKNEAAVRLNSMILGLPINKS